MRVSDAVEFIVSGYIFSATRYSLESGETITATATKLILVERDFFVNLKLSL